MVLHLYGKILWDGTDGTFTYGGEGSFYQESKSPDDTLRGKRRTMFM